MITTMTVRERELNDLIDERRDFDLKRAFEKLLSVLWVNDCITNKQRDSIMEYGNE